MTRITPEALIDLGFVRHPEFRFKWHYKGYPCAFSMAPTVSGVRFLYFADFTPGLECMEDVKFITKLIDAKYAAQEATKAYEK